MSQNKSRNTTLPRHEETEGKQSRRHVLKMLVTGLLAGLISPMTARLANAATVEKTGKVLIVYFSKTGNTRVVAQQIQSATGGDLLELKTVHTYPEKYRATTEQAKEELANNFRPQLSTQFPDMQLYDVICIGYPNWWGTLPTAFFSFFDTYPLAGKTIVPFCTHAGSGLGRGPQDIARFCPQAKLLSGFAVRGSNATEAQSDVTTWLRQIGISS